MLEGPTNLEISSSGMPRSDKIETKDVRVSRVVHSWGHQFGAQASARPARGSSGTPGARSPRQAPLPLNLQRVDGPAGQGERPATVPIRQRPLLAQEPRNQTDPLPPRSTEAGQPVRIISTCLRWDEAQGTLLMQAKTGKDGIYGRLEELSHVMTCVRDQISARMPTPEEAAVLGLLPGVPVLEVLHTSLDQDGTPFEVSRYAHRADQTGSVRTPRQVTEE